ncbi:MAG: histidinol-phosphate transaminase, partial [Acidimicrobiales bacterium]
SLEGYHSPQVATDVRLNTNESPLAPPPGWAEAFAQEIAKVDPNRYPDRGATRLRAALAAQHDVDPAEVFCANGSNEVLQCLLLAFGGPGRTVATFEPTYALHRFIARLTGTPVVSGRRDERFRVVFDDVKSLLSERRPVLTFLCSPNNPTGNADPIDLIEQVVGVAPGLVVVDEAYGQFAPSSATTLRSIAGGDGLVVVRTFSKTWALAAARLGYLLAHPDVVAACEAVALPYHLSAFTQAAGLAALRFEPEMQERVAILRAERRRVGAALAAMPVETWPSDANFILFRPQARSADGVWRALVDRSVLIRDVSGRPELAGCLRVTIGTSEENDRFLHALEESLR